MPIVLATNNLDLLHTKSTNFESLEEVNQYLDVFKEMKQLLKPKNFGSDNHNGLGLALPQTGINKRGFVFRKGDHYEIAINPKILKYSLKKKLYDESCLSIPEEWYIVERSFELSVVYRDINFNIKPDRLLYRDAEVFQHEYDHLDGVLISDIGARKMSKEELEKLKELNNVPVS
jgi:peptide deformylase